LVGAIEKQIGELLCLALADGFRFQNPAVVLVEPLRIAGFLGPHPSGALFEGGFDFTGIEQTIFAPANSGSGFEQPPETMAATIRLRARTAGFMRADIQRGKSK